MDLMSSNPCVTSESVNVPLANQPPTIEAQGKTYSLPQLIFGAIQSQNFMTQLVPILTNAISPTLQSAIQSAFQNLTDTIENQSKQISTLSQKLKAAEESNQDLQKQIWYLEETVDDLEQYGRRNSFRFHNCPITDGNRRDVNTDKIVTAICKESLNINLSEDNISRSHIIGKPNSRGNIQIICKLKNWKTKNTVYQSIFVYL